MKTLKVSRRIAVLLGSVLLSINGIAQNPNFYIYLCFGQSNMEGQATIEAKDKTVDSRFKLMSAMNCSNLGRTKGQWYTAVPPVCRCYTKLSPADYFGRSMVANLPDSITVGIINVSVSGCDIGIFNKIHYAEFDSTYKDAWFQNILKEYNYNPYQYLVDLAKLAQKDGVIKGILLHQGETNTGDAQWPNNVKTIYNDLLTDLSLNAADVPILAGELVSAAQNGCCSSMNTIINTLPSTIPTAHVISSAGCTDMPDNAHFSSEGYRVIGRRYAVEMLSLIGYNAVYAEAECATVGNEWKILADPAAANGAYVYSPSGTEYTAAPPADASAAITIPFTLSADTTYYLYGRFNNPDANASYWIKIDGGAYEYFPAPASSGWQWLELKTAALSAGNHSISIAMGKPGLALDKIAIKNSKIAPVNIGEEASVSCKPVISTGMTDLFQTEEGYALEQNSPNPFSGTTDISFEIPQPSNVSLKIYSAQGAEIAVLADKTFATGRHTVQCKLDNLVAGNYFYTIKAGSFSATRTMTLAK